MGSRKRIVTLTALAMAVVILISNVLAEDLNARYSYISVISASLQIRGSTAKATGRIVPSGNLATDISVKLQQQQSDGSWLTVASWSNSSSSGFCDAGGSATIVTGYTYRTYVVGHVYDADGNIIDTGTAYKY